MNHLGERQWLDESVAVYAADISTSLFQIVSDSAGGVIIVWQYSPFGISAQRINSDGVPLWGENGVSLCDTEAEGVRPAIAPDDNGGAVIVYYGAGPNLYAQHLNESGASQWGDSGVNIGGDPEWDPPRGNTHGE